MSRRIWRQIHCCTLIRFFLRSFSASFAVISINMSRSGRSVHLVRQPFWIYTVRLNPIFGYVIKLNIQIRPSTLFRILSVFKISHSGEQIQKVADSYAGSSPDTCGRKPNPQWESCGFKYILLRVDGSQIVQYQHVSNKSASWLVRATIGQTWLKSDWSRAYIFYLCHTTHASK